MDKVSSRSPLVLVLAGAGYGQQAPLLWWTDTIVRQAGCGRRTAVDGRPHRRG